jgi:lysophospholipase L1-like esterase
VRTPCACLCWLPVLVFGMSCHPAVRAGAEGAHAEAPVPEPKGAASATAAFVVPPPPAPLRADEVPGVEAVPRPLPELAAFYDALDALRRGRSGSAPLRVLWLGDSHTSADFMTHRVRSRLQDLVGDAGPGFLRLGLDLYRHESATFEVSGRFRQEPALPAQRTRVKDGVFGYGGIRTLPQAGARVRVTVKRSPSPGASQALRWQLSYRLPEGAAVEVRVGATETRLSYVPGAGEPAAAVTVADFEGGPEDAFEVAHVSGAPELFGVFVERARPGLVLDTVGVDGARAATPLAWEPEQFIEEVRARAPALVVLAYGTNEVFDKGWAEQYGQHVSALALRVRAGAGPIPCWVIGPMDASAPGGGSRPRVREVSQAQEKAARELGCAFTSAQALMGGEGSFARWTTARPQLARTDGIHLTIAGYRELGDALADQLLPEKAQPGPAQPGPAH